MKAQLFDSKGSKKAQIELPSQFDTKIRQDVTQKAFEIDKYIQPYSPYAEAGRRHSASGTISHRRHEWKGHYGKGISRAPRKTMWRRGTQFYWIGAEVSGARGGRKAHAPELGKKERNINKKEMSFAFNSALASTASRDLIIKRYSSLSDISVYPAVIESLPSKTKEFISALKIIYGSAFPLVLRKKSVRAGVGKRRGRKYKMNAGLLIVKSKEELSLFSGLDVKSFSELKISDLYPLGRIVLYTKKALEEISKESKK